MKMVGSMVRCQVRLDKIVAMLKFIAWSLTGWIITSSYILLPALHPLKGLQSLLSHLKMAGRRRFCSTTQPPLENPC